MNAAHEHLKEHHALVRNALRTIATRFRAPYWQIRDRFIGGDYLVTAEFWRLVNARHPGQYQGVSFCHGCRRFMLEPMLAA